MSDYERIYLEPECCADHGGCGRLWCKDDVFSGECEEGAKPTEYVRADLYETALAENAVLREALEKLSRLGNEPHLGNSDGNVIAQRALAAASSRLSPGENNG